MKSSIKDTNPYLKDKSQDEINEMIHEAALSSTQIEVSSIRSLITDEPAKKRETLRRSFDENPLIEHLLRNANKKD